MEPDPFTERLAQIRVRFAAKLLGKISSVQTALPELGGADGKLLEVLATSHRNIHELCGIAPTVGFPETGQQARRVERMLLQPLHAKRCLSADEIAAVHAQLQVLEAVAQSELQFFEQGN
jgi:HPt (histidine-containing phosphotransfer) domain-containing protein